MSTSLLRDTQYIRKMAQAANIKVTDDACKLIAFEVESVLRLVIQVQSSFFLGTIKTHFFFRTLINTQSTLIGRCSDSKTSIMLSKI